MSVIRKFLNQRREVEPRTKQISVRVEPSLEKRLQTICQELGVSVSDLLREQILASIAEYERETSKQKVRKQNETA